MIQEDMKLYCWQEHQIHPYFKVGPLQVELLSRHPKSEVVMYHNVLSQRLSDFLKNDTGRRYVGCWTANQDPKLCLYSKANIYENSSEEALRTIQLTSRITGLKTTKRGIRSHVYAPGGHIAKHTDTVSLLSIFMCTSPWCWLEKLSPAS